MALLRERSSVRKDAFGDVTVVRFTGFKISLDEETLHGIREQLLALAAEPSPSDVLLDFGNVEYITSTALGTLVSLHKKLLARGRHLTVSNLIPQVHEVFAVTRLDKILDLRLAEQNVEPMAPDGPPCSPVGILVVDDEQAILGVAAARLRLEGYKVWVAHGCHQAIDFYQRHREEIAVVLLDVLMPGLDGPHTLTRLQELCPAVRCCFMTGNPTPYTEEGLLRMGAIRVFQKPFAFTEVVDTLDQLTCRPPRRCQNQSIGNQETGV